ncbi:hypothetical protein [Pseudomonas sp. FW300-N1A1]|uniref:hypothetical protein n=1 Tax=Pseudomonas sp. FW300-N1A1 TaxID=2075555 RepID=UPI001304C42D|nr:hypothetical protein [Pseudomonas sp. FW300-N1A1]
MSSTASNGAAHQSPDEYLRSASRWGGRIKIKIKSQSKIKGGRRANARPVEWWEVSGGSWERGESGVVFYGVLACLGFPVLTLRLEVGFFW